MHSNLSIYNKNAEQLSEQYNTIHFEAAHKSWQAYWPEKACSVLDIGAGNGRDAKWLAHLGCNVIAVEPAIALNKIGQQNTGNRVRWFSDQLPELEKVQVLGIKFDLILLSAIWMHIPSNQREQCFYHCARLLNTDGILVITLRHGEFSDGRTAFAVSAEELQLYAKQYALNNILCTELDSDQLGRADVYWQTLVFSSKDTIKKNK